jgi:hypothetical protein
LERIGCVGWGAMRNAPANGQARGYTELSCSWLAFIALYTLGVLFLILEISHCNVLYVTLGEEKRDCRWHTMTGSVKTERERERERGGREKVTRPERDVAGNKGSWLRRKDDGREQCARRDKATCLALSSGETLLLWRAQFSNSEMAWQTNLMESSRKKGFAMLCRRGVCAS